MNRDIELTSGNHYLIGEVQSLEFFNAMDRFLACYLPAPKVEKEPLAVQEQ